MISVCANCGQSFEMVLPYTGNFAPLCDQGEFLCSRCQYKKAPRTKEIWGVVLDHNSMLAYVCDVVDKTAFSRSPCPRGVEHFVFSKKEEANSLVEKWEKIWRENCEF